MTTMFSGQTADSAWRKAVRAVRHAHGVHAADGRGGSTMEISQAVFTITDSRQRWITSRVPAINPAFAIAECVWILQGRNDSRFVNSWNSELPRYAGDGETYHGAYGYRLRQQFGIDQLERAYRALAANPGGRQVVLQIWDARSDLPMLSGDPVAPDIPCNVCSFLKIRDGALQWTQIMRSNDLIMGVPYNFVQFTTLQEIIAGWLGVGIGTYSHLSDSLHVYEHNQDAIQSFRRVSTGRNMDDLTLPFEESHKVIGELAANITILVESDIKESGILKLIETFRGPASYRNLLLVMAAEAARKRGWHNFALQCIVACENDVYRRLWIQWARRLQARTVK